MKLDILAFGAHPDDVELGCGGMLAKESAAGKRIGIVDLTRGEMGTRGTPEIREKEAAAAAEILGCEHRENLRMDDAFFANDKENQLKVVEVIRRFQPEIVIANAPSDRHPDHGRASELVRQAAFLSGLRRIEDGHEAWRPKALYHYIQFQNLEPDVIVDIEGFLDKKMESISAHKSQFFDPNSDEPETVISKKSFMDYIIHRTHDMGRLFYGEQGEGFVVERIPAVNSLFDLK